MAKIGRFVQDGSVKIPVKWRYTGVERSESNNLEKMNEKR
jgi:hypothetical protein